MKFIDLFAGIGGFRRGMELAGHKCVGFCEWDKYAAASYISMHLITEKQRKYLAALDLKKRQKEILRDEYRNGEWYSNDIRNVDAGSMPQTDCWCFGAPCQDFSVAGKRAGLGGDRSSLVREIFRILREIKEESRPEWLIYENVKGMLSSNRGFDFLEILLAMDELGYDIEWQLFNSKDWGVPQNRERVYTVGHLRRCGARKIFPLTGTVGENSIKQLANYLPTATRDNPNQGRIYSIDGIAPCLNKMDGGGREPSVALPCFVDMNYGAGIKQTENARCLQTKYYKGICNRNGEVSGVTIPINEDILLPGNNYNQRKVVHTPDGISRTLISNGHSGNEPKIAIPFQTLNRGKKGQNGRRFKENEEPMFTLTSQDRHGVGIEIKEATKQGYDIAYEGDSINLDHPGSSTRRGRVGRQIANTLDTSCDQGIFVQVSDELTVYAIWYEKYQCYIAIRKLTPKECFRLQGWEDIYFERAAFVNSDRQLYKQTGNGVTVSVVYIIGKSIAELEET